MLYAVLFALLPFFPVVAVAEKPQNHVAENSPPEAATQPSEKIEIAITDPGDDAKVPARHRVRGTTNDTEAEIWLVVHPTEIDSMWVQGRANIKKDGTWVVSAAFGEPNMHQGKPYAILAVANPKEPLKKGQQLHDWPEAEAWSPVVEVTRQ